MRLVRTASELAAEPMISNPSPATPQVKDNRMKAIVFMNMAAIGGIGSSIIFKLAAKQGATPIDYCVIRNLCIFMIGAIECRCLKKSPFSEFPWENKHTLFWRILTGQLVFFLI